MNATASADVWTKAREATGNWKKFKCFSPASCIEDTDTIITLSHRDERLLEQSNREAIEAALTEVSEQTNGDYHEMSSNHFAFGHTYDVVMAPILKTDSEHPAEFVNPVFEKLFELQKQMEDYPCLDEEDYSRREYEATIENIKSEFGSEISDKAPENWAKQVYSWLSDFDQEAVDNCDDQGGYPSSEQIRNAIAGICADKMGWIEE